jgi:predicted acylesterase/phospholipase RssA
MTQLKNLVLSGGGVTAIGFLGILKLLYEYDLIKEIEHYIGTSMGAIICYLLTIGFTHNELLEFSKLFNFSKITEDIKLDNFLCNYGFVDMNNIKIILKNISSVKNIGNDITFIHHYEKTNKKLSITGTCLSDFKLYYFNHQNTPNMKIFDAILISCCIPLLFQPIEYDNKCWIDGGIINNFPIDYCNNEIDNTLGIAIKDICFEKCSIDPKKDLPDYLSNLFKCMVYSDTVKKLETYDKNTVKYNFDISIMVNFNINSDEILEIYNDAYEQAKSQINIFQKFIKSNDTISDEPLSLSETDTLQKVVDKISIEEEETL